MSLPPVRLSSLLPLLLLLLLQQLVAIATQEENNDELKGNFTSSELSSDQFSEEALDSIMKNFGQQMSTSIAREMDKLLGEVQQSADTHELERFKRANEALTKDTQMRIELAGAANSGDLTRGWASNLGQNFIGKAKVQLQSAGTYLGHQMTMLSGLAPKVRGQLGAIPGKLLRLMQWPSFLSFKSNFKKVYKSANEEIYRQINYLNNQAACGLQNIKFILGKTSHLLKATQYADLNAAEYQEIYNNRFAETKDDKSSISSKLSAAKQSQLKQLAQQDRNVFGYDLPTVATNSINACTSQHLNRKRRAADTYNELDDSESDDEKSGDDEDDEYEDVNCEVPIVDEYANEFFDGANLNNLAELEDIADQALKEHHLTADFKPIDLRQTGCLIKPEKQLECGCCYAHVVSAAASYYNCIQNRHAPTSKPPRYNARFVSDCGRYGDPPVSGCRGGRLSPAVKFTRIAGTQGYQNYELARLSQGDYNSDECAYPKPPSIERWAPERVAFFEESDFYTISNLDEADLHLRTVGPVWVNIRTWKDFHLQGPGIHDRYDELENPIIHSMLLVGHDRDSKGRDYWILWNSHGTEWGEGGYVRIYTDSLEYFEVFTAGLMPNRVEV